MIEQLIFICTLGIAIYFVRKRVLDIRSNINLGKENKIKNEPGKRFLNMALVAFGQKKMFKRFIPAVLHFFIYVGFLVINIEVIEFVIDGLIGTHRVFAPYLGSSYNILMNIFEALAVAVLLACLVMLIRRNILKIERFWSLEMTSWPRLDANLILITEIVLMFAILTMNAADQALQQRSITYLSTGTLFLSGSLKPMLASLSTPSLVILERSAWWFHIVGILGFAVFITYSKHLHIVLAFPNTYFANVEAKGHIKNMPIVTNEVKLMLGLTTTDANATAPPAAPGRFGAKDVNDLNWNNLYVGICLHGVRPLHFRMPSQPYR